MGQTSVVDSLGRCVAGVKVKPGNFGNKGQSKLNLECCKLDMSNFQKRERFPGLVVCIENILRIKVEREK